MSQYTPEPDWWRWFVFVALLAGIMATIATVIWLATPKALAMDEDAARRDCASDALVYCSTEISQGRASIIRCMKRNRHRLNPQCRVHFK